MKFVGRSEKATKNRVLTLFCEELGYRYLGDWSNRDGNSNIEESYLSAYLIRNGYSSQQISAASRMLRRTEADTHSYSLYSNNQNAYNLLRYGVPIKIDAGQVTETLSLIDWGQPENNDFAIAEEVTLTGSHERRLDLVLYLNGIAIAVLELKHGQVNTAHSIRHNLSNQSPEFNVGFFTTVQFFLAGNDSEVLQYGAIGTEEKYFLKWKEDEQDNSRFKLDKYLLKLCHKARLIELLHDFVLFDGEKKKLPRVHQYFAIKAAQAHIRERKSGVIWHTQGSGKSIVMVLLVKWLLQNYPYSRVVIVTDRDELDKRIERVFSEIGVNIKRSNSGRDMLTQLAQPTPRLLCSLIPKLGGKRVDDFDLFIKDLDAPPSRTVGQLFVFVDECHSAERGRLHRMIKSMLPNAVFIGFTGTPLLKKDKAISMEIFGGYIHTYKFGEAAVDGVVLDLLQEGRDIDHILGTVNNIDTWFEAKTKTYNDLQKDKLKKKSGSMLCETTYLSQMDRVVSDIIFDLSVKPRLSNGCGNAILVAQIICRTIRPDARCGIQVREQVIKQALYSELQDLAEVERIYRIISEHKAQF